MRSTESQDLSLDSSLLGLDCDAINTADVKTRHIMPDSIFDLNVEAITFLFYF